MTPRADRPGADELPEGRADRRHGSRSVLRPAVRDRAGRARRSFPQDLADQKTEADGHAGDGGHQPAPARDDPAGRAGAGPAPQGLRRHRRALRAGRRCAAVDAREGPRPRLHARDEGGLDRGLHRARGRDDGSWPESVDRRSDPERRCQRSEVYCAAIFDAAGAKSRSISRRSFTAVRLSSIATSA